MIQGSKRRAGTVTIPVLVFALLAAALAGPAAGQSLRGSQASVSRQYRAAQLHDFTMMRSGSHIRKFVSLGLLIPVEGNADYELVDVSYPYARPATRLFVERLSRQYHAATGEKLVVTSLTRPLSDQPRNASRRSVHPAGIAVDLRRSRSRAARQWLEKVLMSLEQKGVIEATRERHPPHYHVAVFPDPYEEYVSRISGRAGLVAHNVRPGENLWTIARRYGSSVRQIQQANGIHGTEIFPGQVLKVPSVR